MEYDEDEEYVDDADEAPFDLLDTFLLFVFLFICSDIDEDVDDDDDEEDEDATGNPADLLNKDVARFCNDSFRIRLLSNDARLLTAAEAASIHA